MRAALGLLLDPKVVQRSNDVWTSLLMSLDGLSIVHLDGEVEHRSRRCNGWSPIEVALASVPQCSSTRVQGGHPLRITGATVCRMPVVLDQL